MNKKKNKKEKMLEWKCYEQKEKQERKDIRREMLCTF